MLECLSRKEYVTLHKKLAVAANNRIISLVLLLFQLKMKEKRILNKTILTVPNQRIITVNKSLCNKDNIYTIINMESLKTAMNLLKNNSFKFWMYFTKNQDGFYSALSKVDALKWCNFSERTYTNTFSELEKLGYLIKNKDGSNHYNFYDLPQKKEENQVQTRDELINIRLDKDFMF